MKRLFIGLLFLTISLNASTMFMLTKVPKAYLVVENYSKKLPSSIKENIMEELKNTTDELKIDTSGFAGRTLAFIIYESYLDDMNILNIELVLGEEVRRVDDNEEVYGLTYRKQQQFILNDKEKDDIEDETMEKVDELLTSFFEQYIEDNE